MLNKKIIKNRTKLNLVIDVVMLVLLMSIAGLGLLIKYVLVPGYKRNILYGGDIELYFMGLTRHEWGSIHLWLSFIFLSLMLLHIILHWKMITCIFGQMIVGKTSRTIIAIFIGVVALFFVITPLYVKPEVTILPRKHVNKHTTVQSIEKSRAESHDVTTAGNKKWKGNHKNRFNTELEIYGYMTLNEVSKKYSIPIEELTKALNIPAGQSDEKIGRLKRRYGFQMTDLKDTILKNICLYE